MIRKWFWAYVFVVCMTQVCGGDKPYIAPVDLQRYHEEFKKTSMQQFCAVKKMGGVEFSQRYREQLETELDEVYTNFGKHNESKNIFLCSENSGHPVCRHVCYLYGLHSNRFHWPVGNRGSGQSWWWGCRCCRCVPGRMLDTQESIEKWVWR